METWEKYHSKSQTLATVLGLGVGQRKVVVTSYQKLLSGDDHEKDR